MVCIGYLLVCFILLVKFETCYVNNLKSINGLFLTNKHFSFQFTRVTQTGLSNLKPKIISYCNFKRFGEQKFIAVVKNANFSFEADDPSENYSVLTLFL